MGHRTALVIFLFLSLLTGSVFQIDGVGVDSTSTSIDISKEGDAAFELEVRTRLEDKDDVSAFRNVTESGGLIGSYRDSMSRLVDRVSSEVGREMNASNFTTSWSIETAPVRRGVVRYRFNWSNFAEVQEDGVRMDGVLSGYVLGENDRLVVVFPQNHTPKEIDPQPTLLLDDRAVWEGGYSFDKKAPLLELEREAEEFSEEDRQNLILVVGAGLVLICSLAAISLVYRDQDDGRERREFREEGPVLSDSEVVLRILDSEGGKMKQKKLMDETDWSQSKVSQVTSDLEEKDEIEKLRMGRENILRFPDSEDEIGNR